MPSFLGFYVISTSKVISGRVENNDGEHKVYSVDGFWSFMSVEHLRSYEDGYRLVTVWTHDFIVLPHAASTMG